MKNWSALLLALVFSGHAYADRIASNLEEFTIEDVCSMTALAYIDRDESEEDEIRMDGIIQDLAETFDIGISYVFNDEFKDDTDCSQGSYIIFQAIKTNLGHYIYTYRLSIYSKIATATKYRGETYVEGASFYDNGGFGIVKDLASLKEIIDESTSSVFREFVTDWRKTH